MCFSSPFFFAVGPYIGRYCGQNTPGRIISYTGILALTINTDSAIAKEGFSANFTVIERTVPEGELAQGHRTSDRWGGGDTGETNPYIQGEIKRDLFSGRKFGFETV